MVNTYLPLKRCTDNTWLKVAEVVIVFTNLVFIVFTSLIFIVFSGLVFVIGLRTHGFIIVVVLVLIIFCRRTNILV
jgi:hypothetical protein